MSTAPGNNIIQMVTHPDINPIQKGLTSVKGQEPVFPLGEMHTPSTV